MALREWLKEAVQSGDFTIQAARRLVSHDWRSALGKVETSLRQELESIFYFSEGYIEEFDEGFTDDAADPELFARIERVLKKL